MSNEKHVANKPNKPQPAVPAKIPSVKDDAKVELREFDAIAAYLSGVEDIKYNDHAKFAESINKLLFSSFHENKQKIVEAMQNAFALAKDNQTIKVRLLALNNHEGLMDAFYANFSDTQIRGFQNKLTQFSLNLVQKDLLKLNLNGHAKPAAPAAITSPVAKPASVPVIKPAEPKAEAKLVAPVNTAPKASAFKPAAPKSVPVELSREELTANVINLFENIQSLPDFKPTAGCNFYSELTPMIEALNECIRTNGPLKVKLAEQQAKINSKYLSAGMRMERKEKVADYGLIVAVKRLYDDVSKPQKNLILKK